MLATLENVDAAVWRYEVDGTQVLLKWFSYRKANRERPIIGERRKPSPLGNVQSTQWQPEYTSELLNVLNVLGLLVDIEPKEAEPARPSVLGSADFFSRPRRLLNNDFSGPLEPKDSCVTR